MRKAAVLLMLAAGGPAQTRLVVDRALAGKAIAQGVERPGGFFADAFRIGAAGEVWMIDAVRVWAIPGKDCGDEKVTLFGALDNPPVPGQPVCDCHALVSLATAAPGPAGSDGARRIDFQNVRWSIPGAADALFTVRAGGACAAKWSLAAGPAAPDYRLHLLNEKGVPIGLAAPETPARSIRIQVWAHRWK